MRKLESFCCEYFKNITNLEKIVSSKEYLEWLYEILIKMKYIDDEYNEFKSKKDKENVSILYYFFLYLNSLKKEQFIYNSIINDDDYYEYEYLYFKYKNKKFKVGYIVGQGSYTYIKLLENELNLDEINFISFDNDITPEVLDGRKLIQCIVFNEKLNTSTIDLLNSYGNLCNKILNPEFEFYEEWVEFGSEKMFFHGAEKELKLLEHDYYVFKNKQKQIVALFIGYIPKKEIKNHVKNLKLLQ